MTAGGDVGCRVLSLTEGKRGIFRELSFPSCISYLEHGDIAFLSWLFEVGVEVARERNAMT